MAIAFGAQASGVQTSAADTTIEATITAVAGDLITVLIVARDVVTISSVVGSLNGAYTAAGALQTTPASNDRAAIYYFENSSGGSETVTVTFSANVRGSINVARWTGAATSGALDQNNGQSNNPATTTPHHGSITTTGAGLIVTSMAAGGDIGTPTQSGFTGLTRGSLYVRDWYGYRIVTGSTTEDGDLTGANSVVAAGKIASFLEAGGGAFPAIIPYYTHLLTGN